MGVPAYIVLCKYPMRGDVHIRTYVEEGGGRVFMELVQDLTPESYILIYFNSLPP